VASVERAHSRHNADDLALGAIGSDPFAKFVYGAEDLHFP
jgi:hypothetical protein